MIGLRAALFRPGRAVPGAPLVVVAGVSVNEKQSLTFPPAASRWPGRPRSSPSRLARRAILRDRARPRSRPPSRPIALPLAWFLWRRTAAGRAFPAAGGRPFVLPPVITALGLPGVLGDVGRTAVCATIVSHAIFFITLPLVTISLGFRHRPGGDRGRRHHGRRRPDRAPDRGAAADPALPGLGLRLRLRAVAQRVHRRLHDGRLHHRDAADQDLQQPCATATRRPWPRCRCCLWAWPS